MVVLDATTLLLLLRPDDVGVPMDPATKQPIERHAERVAYLVQRLDKSSARIVIPTPVIAEAFVRTGSAGTAILAELNNHAVFKILEFDAVAAVELAKMIYATLSNRDKKEISKDAYQKIKIDRHIIAISKMNGATEIYFDDKGLASVAKESGIATITTSKLPLAPADRQMALDLVQKPPKVEDDRDEEEAAEAFAAEKPINHPG